MKNLTIIYGAKSCEHDISIITACLAKGYFADFNVYCVYLDKNNVAYLAPNNYTPAMHISGRLKQKVVFLFGERAIGVLKHSRICKRIPIDAVVNCCHGANGEDGTVATIYGLLNVPVVGSDITSSSVAMDKILSKIVMRGLDLPVVDGFEVNANNIDRLNELTANYTYPLIVKPNTLGSSIGVAVCKTFDELKHNLDVALKYDDRVLVEKALTDFCELNCAAMRTQGSVQISRVDIPTTANDILTFADKYVNGSADVPVVNVSNDVVNQVKSLTAQIYQQICFSGVIRVDYLYDKSANKLYVNEINSIPGSLAYGLFSDVYGITEYGNALEAQAESDFKKRCGLVTSFASSVLDAGRGKHAKK